MLTISTHSATGSVDVAGDARLDQQLGRGRHVEPPASLPVAERARAEWISRKNKIAR